jgi:type VI secretion system protein ImpE
VTYDPDIHQRRSIRLPGYDYSTFGGYFVTICTQGREALLGKIVGEEMLLNAAGWMVETIWRELPQRFPNVTLDEFITMPNHFHAILIMKDRRGESRIRPVHSSNGRGESRIRPVHSSNGRGESRIRPVHSSNGRGEPRVRPVHSSNGRGESCIRPVHSSNGRGESRIRPVHSSNGRGMGALVLRTALHGERTRQELFATVGAVGGEAPPTAIAGTLDGQPFSYLSDADPRVGARLEVFVAGQYTWLPLAQLAEIHVSEPKRLRDTLWAEARVKAGPNLKDFEFGEVIVPCIAPLSWQNSDWQVRLGREIDWKEMMDGAEVPFGPKMLQVDDELVPILQVRELIINPTEPHD